MELVTKNNFSFFVTTVGEAKQTIIKVFKKFEPFKEEIICLEKNWDSSRLDNLASYENEKTNRFAEQISNDFELKSVDIESLYGVTQRLTSIFLILSDLENSQQIAMLTDDGQIFDNLFYFLLMGFPIDNASGKIQIPLFP